MSDTLPQDPMEVAFQHCKENAGVDGAFSDTLLRFWFHGAWDLCAGMVGFVWPRQFITEPVIIRPDGSFRISYQPSSEIKVYDGATLLMVLPRSGERDYCDRGLCPCCACCTISAQYWTGQDLCSVNPLFLQAVARLFAWMVENRGDATADYREASSNHMLTRSGAMTYLSGLGVAYVL